MNVQYREKDKQSRQEYALLEQATNYLEEILGPSAQQVVAAWQPCANANGRAGYVLSLADDSGEVATTFSVQELRSPTHIRINMLELWGDLLQLRSAKQMHKLQQLVMDGE